MKFTLATVTLVFICLNIHMSACNMHDHVKEVSKACKAKLGTSDDVIAKLKAHEDVSDDKMALCHMNCLMEDLGAMQDGALNEHKLIEILSEHLSEDEAKQLYESCKDITGEDSCAKGYKIATCICEKNVNICHSD